MGLKVNIRQILAALLMLIFLLGVTPKKFLHDAVTKHQHTYQEHCSHQHTNIASTGFNCQIDNLVVELPFEISIVPTFSFVEPYHISYSTTYSYQNGSSDFFTALLRGPPTFS